jgi:hypothetical protein
MVTPTRRREAPLASNDAAQKRDPHRVAAADELDRERPEVVHDSHGLVMATWKNVALHVWTTRATPAIVDTLDDLSELFISAHPEGVSAVHLIAANTALPDADVRERLRQVTNRHAKHLACVCHIVEGSGFWASALHSFLTGLHLLARGPFKLHICADIPAAARWVPAPHMRKTNVSLDSAELEEVLTYLRRRPQQ